MGELFVGVDEAQSAQEASECSWIQARWLLTRSILPAGRRWDRVPALNLEDDFIGSHSGRREFALVGHRKDLALFSD